MKQVIARSPVEVKALLLQAINGGCNWNDFMKYAENASWIAFPEKIVNSLSSTEKNLQFKKTNFNNSVKGKGGKGFCRLHGETNHSMIDCHIIKLVESKGWSRKTNKIVRVES